MLDWSKLPDLGAVTLLACAFASVSRQSHAPVSRLWLTGWVMIAIHFAASLFLPAAGRFESAVEFIGIAALVWAGLLFMWACVPYREKSSSQWMLAILLGTSTLYIALITMAPAMPGALTAAAVLLGASPLALALVTLKRLNRPLRWAAVALFAVLGVFLLAFQHRAGNGADLALNAILFAVYFGCCIHFRYAYRRATAGAFITLSGFFAWSLVFVVAPGMGAFMPGLHLESEVWNLPKYVVAVGMILLLLEEQIEHNKYLALHDELTGLPNRRLFLDRLANALERARRTESQTALLLIDLDRFKQVNDTLGHHVGDLLLKRIGAVFSGRVRRSDTVARTGGDEFSVILEEPTSREDAERVGHSLMQLLKEPLDLGDYSVRVGASVGIAVFPEDACCAEALCIAADLRMYDDKQQARRLGTQAQPPAKPPFPSVEAPANIA